MKIELLQRDDIQSLIKVYAFLNSDDPENVTDLCRCSAEQFFENPSFLRCFVIKRNNDVIASATLNIIPNLTRGGLPYALIENVITHPGFRKLGMGKLLMDHCKAEAIEAGCYKIMLLSSSDRPSSHLFYENTGFDSSSKKAFYTNLK